MKQRCTAPADLMWERRHLSAYSGLGVHQGLAKRLCLLTFLDITSRQFPMHLTDFIECMTYLPGTVRLKIPTQCFTWYKLLR